MGDVIEACADGGFDIPTTPVAAPASRLTSRSSTVDRSASKPRRIRIQLEDDDDDDDDDDEEDENDGDRDLGRTPARASVDQVLSSTKAQSTNNAARSTDAAAGEHEKAGSTPALNKPEYKIYKIETPNEDPMLEIIVSLSSESKAAPISTTTAAAAAKLNGANSSASSGTSPEAKNCCRGGCPSVSVSSDGRSVVVDPNLPIVEGGGGGDGGDGVRGRFSLKLPQRVVPGTAMSFFWEGDLTVRATLASAE